MPGPDDLVARIAEKARRFGSLPAVVSPERLSEAERALGFGLPPLLRELYLHVSDGGFGPGTDVALPGYDAGVLLPLESLVAGYADNLVHDPEMPFSPWPRGAVTMLRWGGFGEAVVDCLSPSATVLLYESDVDEVDPEAAWKVDAPSLAQWWEEWLAGVERQPTEIWTRRRP